MNNKLISCVITRQEHPTLTWYLARVTIGERSAVASGKTHAEALSEAIKALQ